MKTETIKVKLTFTEPTLGTSPGNRKIYEDFKAEKAPGAEQRAEEAAALPLEDQLEKASTVFPKDDQGLFAWDYQMRGFFKEAIFGLIELGDIRNLTKWSYKRAVDSFLFVNPRRIYYLDASGVNIPSTPDVLERPLRATTMQGDRVALARSEMLPAGTSMLFTVQTLLPESARVKKDGGAIASGASIGIDQIKSCLEYGKLKGFSQWRGGGYGRFTWEEMA